MNREAIIFNVAAPSTSLRWSLLMVFGAIIVGCSPAPEKPPFSWPEWREFEVSASRFDGYPESPDQATVAANHLWVAEGDSLFKSNDSGRHWEQVSIAGMGPVAGIRISDDGQRIAVVSASGFLWKSDDEGVSWSSTDFRQALKKADPDVDIESDHFSIERAVLSKDFEKITLIANCEILISDNGGRDWRSLTKSDALPHADTEFHCFNDFTLDKELRPVFAESSMTGSIHSGSYVLGLDVESKWHTLCTLDVFHALAKIAPACADFPETGAGTRFGDGLAYWLIKDQAVDAIFESKSYPIPEHLRQNNELPLLRDPGRSRAWLFYGPGIAMTSDEGENWQVLRGGINHIYHVVEFDGARQIGVSDSDLVVSHDALVWQRDTRISNVNNVVKVGDFAIVLSDNIARLSDLASPPDVVYRSSEPMREAEVYGDRVWAWNEQQIVMSDDLGKTWLSADAPIDNLGWRCADVCLQFSWQGELWRAVPQGGALSIAALHDLNLPSEQGVNQVWQDQNLTSLVVQVIEEDSERQWIYYSVDAAQSWQLIEIRDDKLNDVLFSADATIELISDKVVTTLDAADGSIIARFRLPETHYLDTACVSSGQPVIEMLTDHPDLPSEDDYLVWFKPGRSADWVMDTITQSQCADIAQ